VELFGEQLAWPTYNVKRSPPTYQWRTAVVAALNVLDGKQVPDPKWVLPQPAITEDVPTRYIDERMPPLHYSLCGCQNY
jgi:ribose transport system substrate-binding protein